MEGWTEVQVRRCRKVKCGLGDASRDGLFSEEKRGWVRSSEDSSLGE